MLAELSVAERPFEAWAREFSWTLLAGAAK
jgi:hypothetical protein